MNYFDIQVLMMVTETETLTSTLHHNIFTYLDYVFFCYLYTVGFQSIFTFILSFRKNKYQKHPYPTFNMDDSKLSIDMKNCCVFLNKWEVLSRFFGKSNIFKYFSTCQTRSNDFWIMNTMCTFMSLFVVYFSFAPVISASIHRYVNRNVNVDFTS